jgi:hypothetical protein
LFAIDNAPEVIILEAVSTYKPGTVESSQASPPSELPTAEPTLFPLSPPPVAVAPSSRGSDPKRGARIREAERSQLAWGPINLDATLAEDHPARASWAVIERLDLSALYAQIEARDEIAGAPAIDP